jgi:hypothetical protein
LRRLGAKTLPVCADSVRNHCLCAESAGDDSA